jgi:16S rRNA (guanine1207-N2)-methyltransferase
VNSRSPPTRSVPGGSFRSLPLNAELLEGATVVLVQLPKSLPELDEWMDAVARWADPSVTVVAGGRIKHMTTAMNGVIGRSFHRLDIGRARQKSRTLTAREPRAELEPLRHPTTAVLREPAFPGGELTVSAHGGAFAGASLDIGTRYLLGFLTDMLGSAAPDADRLEVIDLGSGTGILATALALADARVSVTAIDQSAAAVASTRETAEVNGVADRVHAVREDALSARPDASADLIVCNPPFHIGAAVAEDAALRMLTDSARVLRRGGALWTVFNSHLDHLSGLRRAVGPTEVVGRNAKFTVTLTRPSRT